MNEQTAGCAGVHQRGPTMNSAVFAALRRYPDRVAFSWDGGHCTYREAADMIGRFQAVLAARGCARGQVIALLGGNRAEVWCAGAAAGGLGMATTWLHPLGSTADRLFQLDDSGASVLLVDERRFPHQGGELAAACAERGVDVLSLGPSPFAPDLATLAERHGPATVVDLARPSDLSNIGYTGGTTGTPKGVERSHAANAAVTGAVLAGFELPPVPRFLAAAPISHVGGSKVVPTLIRGGTVHLVTGFDPSATLRAIGEHGINCTLLVPSMIYALLDAPELGRADLSPLELVLYGASPISPDRLGEGLDRLGPVFSQMFGQTECYPISLLRRDEHRVDEPGLLASCGFPLPGVAVSIRGEDGSEVPDGEPGELCVRGGPVMDRYHERPDLTDEALAGGWLHTGDVARRDERGYLYIVDRKKDMIISGGFNVYPREVEDALAAHPAVSAAAVYGVPDARWGEAVTASVVLRPGAAAGEAELIAHIRERKGPVLTPKSVRILDALPLTAVGKIDKRRLRGDHPA
ncbi:AMP-binding protein [Tomitella gaofuii]|uniref:AMP-binding protein n=1 Tax=Tomitella gaofuii TaxID=2760083 RepID=UPI001C715EED|nr:AMP-binding protein [Tomitella gaofuii]